MRHLLFAAMVAAAMTGIVGTTLAMPLHADSALRIKPLLIQNQTSCPAGYHWQAAGYTTNGKYRDAGCVRD